jgi:alpha-methylacyl-CoA racemase
MPGPLSDLRVIELGGIGPVPHAGMILADLGAEVVQIVRPATTGHPGTEVLDRGKRSIGVDLKEPEGCQVLLDLVARADALVEGFRPGVAERLGLGPDECRARNPALVYGRMTGWGQEGPLSSQAGHDIDYIAVSGVLAAIGSSTEPFPPLNLVGDFGGGSMLLVMGVLAALHEAARTGEGQVVDAAMVDGSALLMAMHHGARAGGWWAGARGTELFDGAAPFYTTYAAADGERVAVGALESQFYAALVEGLGLQGEDLPAQMDRSGWPRLRRRFADVFATRTREDWEAAFAGTDACVVGVYSMIEAPDHPHLRARGTFLRHEGITQPGPAPRFSTGPLSPGRVPEPGADTGRVLADLGYEEETISRLRSAGLIS